MATEITASKPLKIDTAFNTRDLGGYKTNDGKTTKMHVFLRSDLPAQITDYSKKVLLNYGVRCVIDLRSLVEVNSMPNALTRINRKSFFAFPPRFKYNKENIGGCIHVTYG